MLAVVTGAAGFIGSHLIQSLLARGDRIIGVERPGASRHWLDGLPIETHEIGLQDAPALARLFDGSDVVYHLAGLTEARRSQDFYAVNTKGTAEVLRAAALLNGRAPRVVLASSIAAVGPCRGGDCLDPDTVPFPISHYGHSKLLAEAMVHAYGDRVPGVILRFPSVYGPRERAILKLFKLVRHGVALTVGHWDREVSLIYVEDAVQGLIAAGTAPSAAGHCYCVAHPGPVSWRQFAQAVGDAVGRRPRLVSLPVTVAQGVAVVVEAMAKVRGVAAILNRERVREMTQERWVCDPTRAIQDLAFRPAFDVPRGVGATAAWYREQRWL